MAVVRVAVVGLWLQTGLCIVSPLVADVRERASIHAGGLLENHGNNGARILV